MGFRIHGPHVVAFLEWVTQKYPDLLSFESLSSDERRSLLLRYRCTRPNLRLGPEFRHLISDGFERLAEQGYSVVHRPSVFRRAAPTNDALATYRSAPAKAIFLYTDQDTEFRTYLSDFWRSLDIESGSLLHFFDYGLDGGIPQSRIRPRASYSFAEDYIRALHSIPGADLARIRAVGIPCMLLWAASGQSAIVPFADVQHDQAAMRDRFRDVIRHLAVADIASLRTLFEPIAQAAQSGTTDVFISYKHDDRAWTERLATAVSEIGAKVWFDKDLTAGERWDIRIRHMLSRAKMVLVIWSQRSIESQYVLSEADYARMRDTLVPIFMEMPLIPPVPFNNVHGVDLSTWSAETPLPQSLRDRIAALNSA